MSRGFVKDYEGQWLHEISPTMRALTLFLVNENNGIRVYEKKTWLNEDGVEMHEMSNGITYYVDKELHQWKVLE